MNIPNDCLFCITKENIIPSKAKKNFISKINIKRNIRMMNDPAFHLNKTVKEYITNKLKKNYSTEKLIVSKEVKDSKIQSSLSNIFQNTFEHNNNFNRIKAITNIVNKNKTKIFSKKKKRTIKNKNSKSNKKFLREKSNSKFNISHYIFNYHNRSNNLQSNIFPNQKMIKKNSFNSSQKYFRCSESTALSVNDNNNQIINKNNNTVIHGNNQFIPNQSTLERNSLNSPFVQSTTKKNKNNKQYFKNKNAPKNSNSKEKYYYTNNKTENYVNNINITEKNNNKIIINNKEGNINIFPNNQIKKSFNNNKNNSVVINTMNINNKTDNYINSNTKNDFNKTSYNISNENMNNYNKKDISKKENKNDDSNEYLKKIEILENENKLLKGEINESKNRLMILENKIGELLNEKKLAYKEQCPQPMPYVKKYSIKTSSEFYPSNSSNKKKEKIEDDDKGKEKDITPIKNNDKKIIYKMKKAQTIGGKIKNKNIIKKNKSNKSIKYNRYPYIKSSMNSSLKQKSLKLRTSKSISLLRTRNNTDTHLKVNMSNKSNKNNNIKYKSKELFKKVNFGYFDTNNNSVSKNHFTFHISTEGNNKK